MPHKILNWSDIQDDFNQSLLVGNGGSIAVHPGFMYDGLYEQAGIHGYITDDVKKVFEAFATEDFELVLRRLWQAKSVNTALKLESIKVDEAYAEVRDALIQTIQATHIPHDDSIDSLHLIYRFMRRFRTVASLSYDLLVYWATLLGNEKLGSPYHFKDCFYRGTFSNDWDKYRKPFGSAGDPTIFCYPHGNIALGLNPDFEEVKISATADGDLLNTIFQNWKDGSRTPLFICEGQSNDKLAAIMKSTYLRSVYENILANLGENLVIYGWQMAKQEQHILNRIATEPPKRVAVSVYQEDQDYCEHALKNLQHAGIKEIVFYDSGSAGAWNNPL